MIFFISHAQGFPLQLQGGFYFPEESSEKGPLKGEVRSHRCGSGCEG